MSIPVSYTHLDVYKRQHLSDIRPPEIEIKKEIDIDLEKDGELKGQAPARSYGRYENVFLTLSLIHIYMGRTIWQNESRTVSNTQLKAMVEAYKERPRDSKMCIRDRHHGGAGGRRGLQKSRRSDV